MNGAERSTEAGGPMPDAECSLYYDLGEAFSEIGAERSWAMDGAIEGNPVALLVGPEKRGKSWMLADYAVAVATNTKWMGTFQAARSGAVFVVDGEYGPHEYARRVARLARGRGIDPARAFANVRYVFAPPLLLTWENDHYRALFRDIRAAKPEAVIVDPLRNFIDGDENGTSDAVKAFKYLVGLRAGCPVIVAHHLNKQGSMSGARAFKTRADLVLEGTDEEQPWYSAVGRTIRTGDPIAERFTVRIEHEDDEDDRVARTRVRLRFEGAAAEKSGLSRGATRMLDELKRRRAPASANDLGKAVGIASGSARSRAIRELSNAGLAVQNGGKWELATQEFFASLAASNAGGQ